MHNVPGTVCFREVTRSEPVTVTLLVQTVASHDCKKKSRLVNNQAAFCVTLQQKS